jgi:hypothetical protein
MATVDGLYHPSRNALASIAMLDKNLGLAPNRKLPQDRERLTIKRVEWITHSHQFRGLQVAGIR